MPKTIYSDIMERLAGRDIRIVVDAPQGKLINAVGAGDSMVAGFIAGIIKTGNPKEAFKLGVAAGSATAFSEWLADGNSIASLHNTM